MTAGLPSLLQSFFTTRLLRQQQVSPHTVAGYRKSFRLLILFANCGNSVRQPLSARGICETALGKSTASTWNEAHHRSSAKACCRRFLG